MSVLDLFMVWCEAQLLWCTAVSNDTSVVNQLYRHYRESVYLLVEQKDGINDLYKLRATNKQ